MKMKPAPVIRTTSFRLVLIVTLLAPMAGAQAADTTSTWSAGFTVRKMAGFYTLTGFNGEYGHPEFLKGRFRGGFSYTSSSLGTALIRRAIPVHCFELYGYYMLRGHGVLRPFAAISGGYAKANYGAQFRDRLPRSQPLLSPELGLAVVPNGRTTLRLSLGYNLITGNGVTGLGVIYPVYFQLRFLVRVL